MFVAHDNICYFLLQPFARTGTSCRLMACSIIQKSTHLMNSPVSSPVDGISPPLWCALSINFIPSEFYNSQDHVILVGVREGFKTGSHFTTYVYTQLHSIAHLVITSERTLLILSFAVRHLDLLLDDCLEDGVSDELIKCWRWSASSPFIQECTPVEQQLWWGSIFPPLLLHSHPASSRA